MDEKARMRFALKWRLWLEGPMYNGTHCWVWTAGKFSNGYSLFWLDDKSRRGHIVIYEFVYGKMADGMVTDHMCNNKVCVNPAHLQSVTQSQNLRFQVTRDSTHYHLNKTHCSNGHEYSEENTYRNLSNGKRSCRACFREHNRRRRIENPERDKIYQARNRARMKAKDPAGWLEKQREADARYRAKKKLERESGNITD